jgi:hypothetical protein
MIILDGYVKSPDAALRFILRHCGVPEVRLIPQDSCALPAAFLRSRPILSTFKTFYEAVIPGDGNPSATLHELQNSS